MVLNSLKLFNFRCFSSKNVLFSPGVNIIFGENASGKTTILESIAYLALTKSFKTSDESEIQKSGFFEMSVIGNIISNNGNQTCFKIIKEQKGKTVFKNNYKFLKISDYIGEISLVYFSNNDLINLLGSSRNRRKLFEPVFCQISSSYLVECNYYKKLLNERNALLKRLIFEKNDMLLRLLDTLDEQLVNSGKKIIFYRKEFVDKINEKINFYHNIISNKKEQLKIVYKPYVDELSFLKKLKQDFENDLKKGSTNSGPHKDDFTFLINEKNVVLYGSQGQQRSALISLKLTFVDVLKQVKNEYPILLLDDIFSELDYTRQNNLFKAIDKKIQTFISTATLADVDKSILDNANIITLIKED